MRNLGAFDGSNLRGLNCRYSGRMAVEGRKFNLEGVAIRINVDYGPNVTNFQTLLWERRGQNDAVVFSDQLDLYSLAG